ncbi:hypothetical protein TGRUB_431360 [Toxoplasma gondii RUB]|uniref:Uncharacterized protein n=1 Tax=Toxoplasma gondii RUB TaxID=935652 RepID=A0A086LXV9_TOXGO|nr:hypothetical protein TGRUB_431360 [Toxoplasma gondii RUB]
MTGSRELRLFTAFSLGKYVFNQDCAGDKKLPPAGVPRCEHGAAKEAETLKGCPKVGGPPETKGDSRVPPTENGGYCGAAGRAESQEERKSEHSNKGWFPFPAPTDEDCSANNSTRLF